MSREQNTRLQREVAGRYGTDAQTTTPGRSTLTGELEEETTGQPAPGKQRSVFEKALGQDLDNDTAEKAPSVDAHEVAHTTDADG